MEARHLIQALLLIKGPIAARARLPHHPIRACREFVGAPMRCGINRERLACLPPSRRLTRRRAGGLSKGLQPLLPLRLRGLQMAGLHMSEALDLLGDARQLDGR